MDKKNLYLIIIISIFFAIDAIMHNYVFTSNEIIQTNTNIINNENKGLDNLTEDDLKLNEDKHISDKINNTEEIKQNYENQNSEIIKISVKHCSSKSKNFESFKKDLQGNIANLEINSTIYSPSPTKIILSKLVTAIQYIGIAALIMGSSLKNFIGNIIPDNIYEIIKSKRFMIGIFLYMGISPIQNFLNYTGAFEVYVLNNSSYELLYSGLNNKGIIPSSDNIMTSLQELGLIDDN